MLAASRTVRVFISSTFRDMHAEREELVKRVFPQLRKLCEERGVGWTEVDLRWGVTEEQAQRGDYVEADPTARAKLAAMKDRIRSSGLAVRDYPDPQALAQERDHGVVVHLHARLPQHAETRLVDPLDVAGGKDRHG